MAYDITCEIYGDPKGQPRARAFYRKGLGVRMYDPGTAEGWKGLIALALKPHLPQFPLTRPLHVEMHFRFARPKSHLRSNGEVKPNAPKYWHTNKFDLDNLVKAWDAVTQIGLWADDCQVSSLFSTKRWCAPGERPGCVLKIRELTDEPYQMRFDFSGTQPSLL